MGSRNPGGQIEMRREAPAMTINHRLRVSFATLSVAVLAIGLGACGSSNDNESSTTTGAQAIQSNPDNGKVTLTVGSKNFTEEYVLGEIYAQALQAAGYNVKKQLNLGSETIALKALKDGQISGYPEYTSTALESFFGVKPQDVPTDAQGAFEQAKSEFEKEGLTAFPPAPYSSANAVGTLTSTADKLDVSTISDLAPTAQRLTLAGSPECRARIDCLAGLEQDYGLKFKSFTPVDIGLRYTVLDKKQADLSILFTTDAQLAGAGAKKYTLLTDDKHILTPGYPMFVTSQDVVKKAGPDLEKTITEVQQNLDLKTIRELNARVDIDKQQPSDVAHEYLKASGYVQ
jgi:glycine betaine/choline ABC-type transport system substrate-binding protein